MTLELLDVCYRVGGVEIVRNVSAKANPGDLIGLVGPNGAGKSTLANLITGYLRPTSGKIDFNGRSLLHKTPEHLADTTISRSFQSSHLPWNLSAAEAVMTALLSDRVPERERRNSALAVLRSVGLVDQAHKPARDLSFGQQRLLSVAITLGRSGPITILDEPFSGLKSEAAAAVAQLIAEAARDRIVIVIEHALHKLRDIVKSYWFMNKGRLRGFANFHELSSSREFRSDYLGAPNCDDSSAVVHHARHDHERPKGTKATIALDGVTAGYEARPILADVDLRVWPGDVVGVIGLNGSGKSTLLRVMMGLADRFKGAVEFSGSKVSHPTPDGMTRKGVRLLVQDHRLFRSLTVRDNLLVSSVGISSADRDAANRALGALDVPKHLMDRPAHVLSGGEQARIALMQALLGHPILLLLDEPTAGLDGVALANLQSAVRSCQAKGIAVVMAEHALDLVSSLSNRVVLVADGRLRELQLHVGFNTADLEAALMKPS